MSDEATSQEEAPKKGPLKMLLVVVVILVVEAVGIIGAMSILGGPADVAATNLETPELSEDEKITEELVLESRLPNNRSGVTFLYDTEIYVQVMRKHLPLVQAELDQYQNEIRAEIGAIWRTSEPHHFDEPRLENLTRKVEALLTERFGVDPASGEPIVQKCVVVMGTGFRVDS